MQLIVSDFKEGGKLGSAPERPGTILKFNDVSEPSEANDDGIEPLIRVFCTLNEANTGDDMAGMPPLKPEFTMEMLTNDCSPANMSKLPFMLYEFTPIVCNCVN